MNACAAVLLLLPGAVIVAVRMMSALGDVSVTVGDGPVVVRLA
jgi:hypothetical protein